MFIYAKFEMFKTTSSTVAKKTGEGFAEPGEKKKLCTCVEVIFRLPLFSNADP
jgi:hypothetical protein